MARPSDDDVDPRYDPRFQRGYDPARHPAPAERRRRGLRSTAPERTDAAPAHPGPVASAGVPTALPPPVAVPPAATPGAGAGAGVRATGDDAASPVSTSTPLPSPDEQAPDSAPASRRPSIAGIVLLAFAVVLGAGAVVILRVVSAASTAGDALLARPDRFPQILLTSAPTPMATTACVAAVVGIALLLLAPERRDGR